jgi:predicted ATP-grasp superfamily ATP-dependent carboligase
MQQCLSVAMPTDSGPMLVAAFSGRALAASAARAGHRVAVLDYFADRDTCAVAVACRSVVSPRGLRFDRRRLLAAAEELAPPARSPGLVYGSGFEGRLALLGRLAEGRRLFGNPPPVVLGVRDPARFFPLLDRLGIPHPEVRLGPPADPGGWLVKQPGGAGGVHVVPADRPHARTGAYYQRAMRGRSCSALFLADGRRACILGFNEQWQSAARPDLPYLYGGAVGQITLPPAVEADLRAHLDALVSATGLVGLNGVDFLLDGTSWSVLEVNPRPTATMELYDPDYDRGLFDAHLRACGGELPPGAAPARAVRAASILHAARAWRVREGFDFPAWCHDIPRPGTRFAPGDPVCTVQAEGIDAAHAVAQVRERERTIERTILKEAALAAVT